MNNDEWWMIWMLQASVGCRWFLNLAWLKSHKRFTKQSLGSGVPLQPVQARGPRELVKSQDNTMPDLIWCSDQQHVKKQLSIVLWWHCMWYKYLEDDFRSDDALKKSVNILKSKVYEVYLHQEHRRPCLLPPVLVMERPLAKFVCSWQGQTSTCDITSHSNDLQSPYLSALCKI